MCVCEGKYLASCGADNAIIMWDTQSWEAAATLMEPMKGTVDRSMFRRISWAPDGQSICISSAAKATKPIGVVLRRGMWDSVADLVGHQTQAVGRQEGRCVMLCYDII